jgi:uncharacterized protein YjcR
MNVRNRAGCIRRRVKSRARLEAYEFWKDTFGTIPLREVARQFCVPEGTVRRWKYTDKWDEAAQKNIEDFKRRYGSSPI